MSTMFSARHASVRFFADVAEIVFENGAALADSLRMLQHRCTQNKIYLDFRNVERIGSEQLGALIAFALTARNNGHDVSVVNLHPSLCEMLQLIRFDRFLSVPLPCDE